jgi:hypothetical protein
VHVIHPKQKDRRSNRRSQTADKPVDFSAVFLFLGWTVTV